MLRHVESRDAADAGAPCEKGLGNGVERMAQGRSRSNARDPNGLLLTHGEFSAPAPLLPTPARPPPAGQPWGPARLLVASGWSSSSRPPSSSCQTMAALRT